MDYLSNHFYLMMVPSILFFSLISYSIARKDIKEVDILSLPESELSAKPGKVRVNQSIILRCGSQWQIVTKARLNILWCHFKCLELTYTLI